MDTPTIIKHFRGDTSLRDFGEQLGVSYNAVQKWETGEAEPTHQHVEDFINDERDWVHEMGKALWIARHGDTLKSFIK